MYGEANYAFHFRASATHYYAHVCIKSIIVFYRAQNRIFSTRVAKLYYV